MALRIQKRWLYVIDALVLCAAFALVAFGIFNSSSDKGAGCDKAGKEHQLTLQDDTFSSNKLTIQQCDTIKIVNLDTRTFSLAFGVHDRHITYPGFSEQTLRPNEFVVIDAVKAGDYRIHDHLRDQAAVDLVIRPRN